ARAAAGRGVRRVHRAGPAVGRGRRLDARGLARAAGELPRSGVGALPAGAELPRRLPDRHAPAPHRSRPPGRAGRHRGPVARDRYRAGPRAGARDARFSGSGGPDMAMTRFLLALAILVAAGCSSKPSEEACEKAVTNIRKLTGQSNTDVGADKRAAVRSCRAQSSKDKV